MKADTLAVLVTALVFVALSIGRAPAAEQLRLDRGRAIEVAFQNNRELAIAELAVARSMAELRGAGRLDNPELELSLNDDGVGLDDNEGVFEVAFSQRFPITSRLKDEKRLRSSQVLLAEAEIAERRRELAGEVDLAVVDLMAAGRRLETQRGLLEVNMNVDEFEKAQREGQASLPQVQRAQEQQLELRTAAQKAIADYYRADSRVRFVSGDYPGLNPRRRNAGSK